MREFTNNEDHHGRETVTTFSSSSASKLPIAFIILSSFSSGPAKNVYKLMSFYETLGALRHAWHELPYISPCVLFFNNDSI